MGNAPPPHGAGNGSGGGADEGWGPATSIRASGGSRRPRGESPREPAPRVPAQRAPGAPTGVRTGGTRTLPRELDPRPRERGLTSTAAVIVLLVIAGIGAAIDSASDLQGGFNIAIIVASIVAILLVRRSGMFPIVIAPPIVYSAASAAMLYIRSDGLSNHKALYDAAANWLVYGFPAIAGATAAVLIISGVRLFSHR